LLSALFITSFSTLVTANPIPVPSIMMPYEYIDATISVDEGVMTAKVNGTYTFENWECDLVTMDYPIPPNSEGISVKMNETLLDWNHTDMIYSTVIGNFTMISWLIEPVPNRFNVTTYYEHPMPLLDGNYTFLYALGTGKYLETYTKKTTAYIRISININITDLETLSINVYKIGDNSTTKEWIWKPVECSISRKDGTFVVITTITSEYFRPLNEDLLLTFKKTSTKTINVPVDYSMIQIAVDTANPGDTIMVASGTYCEHVTVWKSLMLTGEDVRTTIVDGNGTGKTICVTADNVNISRFMVQNGRFGIVSESNSNSNISSNVILSNQFGMNLLQSSHNFLRNNNMSCNKYNFRVWGVSLSHYAHNIDTSNTVDGKPIYYWVNQHDKRIPTNAGYVAVVNSTNILVKGLTLMKNGKGVLFAYTTNSTIENVNASSNEDGISLLHSSGNTLSRNTVSNNECGIELSYSSGNSIRDNTITLNSDPWTGYGISLSFSYSNTIIRNGIKNNDYSIYFGEANNNTIYHNNFVNNTDQVWNYKSTNIWDNDVQGNYWSDYTGIDIKSGPNQDQPGSDGIGDTAYDIDVNNQDNYPLMGMFYDFSVEIEWGQICHVYVISNSTVSNLEVLVWLTSANEYLQPGDEFIYYVVDGEEGSVGFCRIMVPRVVLNDTYVVLVDWHEVSATELPISNGTHAYLYFKYNHSTQEVVIVPEFPILTSMLLTLTILTIAIAIYKRRLLKTPIR